MMNAPLTAKKMQLRVAAGKSYEDDQVQKLRNVGSPQASCISLRLTRRNLVITLNEEYGWWKNS